jgi:hypothetical protein
MNVELTLGGSVEESLRSSPVEISDDCSERLNLCFHSFDFPSASKKLPAVSIKNGVDVLSLDQVAGLDIFNNAKRMKGKLEAIDLTLRGVPSRSDISLAKTFAYSTIANIRNAGWARYIHPSDPRISGAGDDKISDCNALLDGETSGHPCFDPGYEMSDQQWMALGMFSYWYFHKDGYYLTFKAWRSRDRVDPPREASYLFTLSFESEQEYWVDNFEGDDRLRWKELLPAILVEYQARREIMEREAELAGMTIDRSYKNPRVFALEE